MSGDEAGDAVRGGTRRHSRTQGLYFCTNSRSLHHRPITMLSACFSRTAHLLVTGFVATLFSTAATAQPGNDECSGAIPIAVGINGPFDNIAATPSASPGPFSCGGTGNLDVWFSFVAANSGFLTVSTCGSATVFDTVLEIFDGSAGCAALGTALDCSDDACGFQSRVFGQVTTGSTYYIRAGGFNAIAGTFSLNVTLPENDECSAARWVCNGFNGPYTNAGATLSAHIPWPCGTALRDVWFKYVAQGTGPLTVDTCTGGINDDTVLQVFAPGNCGAGLVSLDCNDDAGCGTTGGASSLTVPSVTGGSVYYIRVASSGLGVVDFGLTIAGPAGGGSFSTAHLSNCTGGLSLALSGDPNIGGTITSTLTGATGAPFVCWGFVAAPVPMPAPLTCACDVLLGSNVLWAFPNGTGPYSIDLTIPCTPMWIGVPIKSQGADLLGSNPACPVPATSFTNVESANVGT